MRSFGMLIRAQGILTKATNIGPPTNNDDSRNTFWLCNNESLGLIAIHVYELVFSN